MKEKDKRIIKEIEKEPLEEKFPIKKPLDLKKEINRSLYELSFIAEFKFLIDKLECKEVNFKECLNSLKGFLSRIATCKIILEKIEGKI